jgi:hypothetical protein
MKSDKPDLPQFLIIRDESLHSKKYVRGEFSQWDKYPDPSQGVTPDLLTAMFSDKSKEVKEVCPDCGNVFPIKPGIQGHLTVSEGTHWPDIVSTNAIYAYPVVAEYVLEKMRKELNVSELKYFPLELHLSNTGEKGWMPESLEDAPTYYRLEPPDGIELDIEQSDLPKIECYKCFKFENHALLARSSHYVIKSETWTGQDIFRINNFHYSERYCSQAFYHLVKKENWTNFSFISGDPDETEMFCFREAY